MSENEEALNRVEMTAEIVSAYVERNSVPVSDLPALIRSVNDALARLSGAGEPERPAEPLQPKVPIRKSVSNDHITCLEDGRRFKSLKRHLHAEHGLSPDEYRAKWGLPKDYPMVAPAYADARSTLAKTIGLGRKAMVGSEVPAAGEDGQGHAGPGSAASDEAPASKSGRGKADAA